MLMRGQTGYSNRLRLKNLGEMCRMNQLCCVLPPPAITRLQGVDAFLYTRSQHIFRTDESSQYSLIPSRL